MTRGQREGRERDRHRCGNPGCPLCSNRRQHDGPTMQELKADECTHLDEGCHCPADCPYPRTHHQPCYCAGMGGDR